MSSEPSTRSSYLPALDGLRGIGVIAVLLYHAGASFANGAVFSISMFFTLSGFLITALALGEVESSGGFGMRAFWKRRFRRLAPAALVTLAAVVMFGQTVADETQRAALRGDVLAALTYVANWRFILSETEYLDSFRTPSPVLHFWSLAIEEQFYVVFVALVAAALWGGVRRRRYTHVGVRWRLGLIAAQLWVISVAIPFIFSMSDDRVYLGTETRASELLAGVVLACLFAGRPMGAPRTSRHVRRALWVLGPVALAVSLAIWIAVDTSSSWIYRGGFAAYGLLSVVLIAAAATPGNPTQWMLDRSVITWIGRRSYGAYLFHFPVFLWLTPLRTGLTFWPLFAVRLTVTLVLADLSYRFLEMPIRRGGGVLRQPLWRVAPGFGVATVLALLVTTVDVESGTVMRAASHAEDFQAVAGPDVDTSPLVPVGIRGATTVKERPTLTTTTTTPQVTTTSLPSAPAGGLPPPELRRPQRRLRTLILGDSTGVFLAYALNEWNRDARVFDLSSYAIMGCGLVRGGTEMTNGTETPFFPICDTWPEIWRDAIAKSRPDVIVVTNGFHDVTDRRLTPDSPWTSVGEPGFDALIDAELALAGDILAATGVPVLWLDNPPVLEGQNQPNAEAERPMNDPMRMAALDARVAALAGRHQNIHTFEYAKFFWTWPGGPFDPALRQDGLHVDYDGKRIVGGWLGPELLEGFWHAVGW